MLGSVQATSADSLTYVAAFSRRYVSEQFFNILNKGAFLGLIPPFCDPARISFTLLAMLRCPIISCITPSLVPTIRLNSATGLSLMLKHS
jgi:hypothetical protein